MTNSLEILPYVLTSVCLELGLPYTIILVHVLINQ